MFIEPVLTDLEKAKIEARKIAYEATVALGGLKNAVREAYNLVWNNPNVSPQAIMDEFGTEAYKLFYTSSETQKLIKKLDPDYVFLTSPNQVTINQDGTVIIGDVITPE